MTAKLDAGQKHMLTLIVKGADQEGWAPVSQAVFPLLQKIPAELIQTEAIGTDWRGRVRLTEKGQHLIYAMDFL